MSSRNPLYTNPKPCKHLSEYKLKYGSYGFNSIQNYLKTTPNGRTSVKNQEKEIPRCSSCNEYQGRLYICLICSSISCSSHTLLHAQSEKGHDIAVDIERSELYCCLCSDQVYDSDFDKTVVVKHIMNLPRNRNGGVEGVIGRSSKRRRLNSGVELDSKKPKQQVSLRDRRAKSCYPLGLRGLNNLGSTCFMNSVLQALLHAPPFRDYFLTDQHNRETCKKRSSSDKLCLLCDIDAIFSSVFLVDRSPYSPAQFLYSWWQHSENLACYEQQDSHDFFMALLDRIHEKEGKARNSNKDNEDCPCIAHRVFSGLLRSDVTCMTCGHMSTTHDPCVDISLDISLNLDMSHCSLTDVANKSTKPKEETAIANKSTKPKEETATANKSAKPREETAISTLLGCLNFFTRPEKLGPDEKLNCQNCQERRDSLKQMSIKRLPLVLCLHIKRFEHSSVRKKSRKIDRYLQFPFHLDMTPYLSSSVVRNRFGNRIFAFEGDDLDTSAEFEIFAVITHSGMLESGHYVTYLRLKNQWYKCDDAWITEVDEGIVRASQCYMLFYVQKMLYKASEDLSCLPLSPRRDPCIPIAGC